MIEHAQNRLLDRVRRFTGMTGFVLVLAGVAFGLATFAILTGMTPITPTSENTLLLMLLFVSALIGIFLLTALFGRVWCGWGCPQTVWMEFIFRPIERLIEGGPNASRALDRDKQHFAPRRLAKYAVYAVLAAILGNTFLAYFVGTDQLFVWMRGRPAEHVFQLLLCGTRRTGAHRRRL